MGNQAEDKVENGETERKNRGTGEATERQGQEEGNGRNRKPSSRKRRRRGRKEPEGKRKNPKAKAKGKHSWNSCGKRSEEGRKETNRKLSTGTGKERTGDQAGENGENRRSESRNGALRKPLRGGDRKKGKGRTEG